MSDQCKRGFDRAYPILFIRGYSRVVHVTILAACCVVKREWKKMGFSLANEREFLNPEVIPRVIASHAIYLRHSDFSRHWVIRSVVISSALQATLRFCLPCESPSQQI
jgi:hypothetical protein